MSQKAALEAFLLLLWDDYNNLEGGDTPARMCEIQEIEQQLENMKDD